VLGGARVIVFRGKAVTLVVESVLPLTSRGTNAEVVKSVSLQIMTNEQNLEWSGLSLVLVTYHVYHGAVPHKIE
jgi:hypothetical protein